MTTGVLFIHGFTGGTYEVEPFANYVASKTNWVIELPTLQGHGATLDLKKASAQNWLMDAELAYRKLEKEVDEIIVVGFSMGGLIAMYLALRYRVKKLVLLSAAAKYISPKVLLDDVRILLTESITKQHTSKTFYNLYNYKLTHTPILSTLEFLKIVKTIEPYYTYIDCPTCIVQGERDGIVPFTTAELLHSRLGSSDKIILTSPTGKHHICYSDDCEEWFEQALKFMEK